MIAESYEKSAEKEQYFKNEWLLSARRPSGTTGYDRNDPVNMA